MSVLREKRKKNGPLPTSELLQLEKKTPSHPPPPQKSQTSLHSKINTQTLKRKTSDKSSKRHRINQSTQPKKRNQHVLLAIFLSFWNPTNQPTRQEPAIFASGFDLGGSLPIFMHLATFRALAPGFAMVRYGGFQHKFPGCVARQLTSCDCLVCLARIFGRTWQNLPVSHELAQCLIPFGGFSPKHKWFHQQNQISKTNDNTFKFFSKNQKHEFGR